MLLTAKSRRCRLETPGCALSVRTLQLVDVALTDLRGDIVIECGNFRLYVPIITSLIIFVVLSLILLNR
jgi:Protein of unknown function (DUF2905)